MIRIVNPTKIKIVSLLLTLAAWTANATTGISYQMQLGNPSNATADTNNHSHYLMQRSVLAEDYNDTLRQPNWVSWDLTTTDVGSSGRSSTFYQDTSLPPGFYQVKPTDYSGSGYDRGHMCPSADRTDTVANNDAVFFMSNIIPQTPDNNQGWWANLEDDCRTIAAAGNELLITSGPSGFGTNKINAAGQVYIASNVWKIIVVVPNGSGTALSRITAATRVIAVNTPNTAGVRSTPWTNFLTSVNQIQTNTGYTFFTTLPTYTASVLRAKIDGQPLPVLPPPLTSSVTNGRNLVLTWPADAVGFALQQNTNVATTNWTTYTGTLTTNGNTVTTILPTTALNNFYRLRHP
jgi:endonuclease G